MDKLVEKINAEKAHIKKIKLSEQYDMTAVPRVIEECHHLEELDLSYSGFTSIPDFVFELPKLKKLSYAGCHQLTSQPTGLHKAGKLETLEIQVPEGQNLPMGLAQLPVLKSLFLSGAIDTLDEQVTSLNTLEELQLFDTRISDLPASIGNLQRLKRIAFRQSLFFDDDEAFPLHLASIFDQLAKCNSLISLSLDSNGLDTIPENISQLKNLTAFSAKENKLSDFPVGLLALSNLKELDLGANQLKNLPTGIVQLHQLKILKLNSNWANKIDLRHFFSVIDQFPLLETLELWSCQSVTHLPENIDSLKKLKKLDVDNNLLSTLPEAIYTMQQLKTLRVSTNKIPTEQINRLKQRLASTKIIG